MPKEQNQPRAVCDDDLNDVAGGRRHMASPDAPEPAQVGRRSAADLKTSPAGPVPIPYPTFPNTKD